MIINVQTLSFTDIIECELSGLLNYCEQVCVNNDGTHECACSIGFVLQYNGFLCDGKLVNILYNKIVEQILIFVKWVSHPQSKNYLSIE